MKHMAVIQFQGHLQSCGLYRSETRKLTILHSFGGISLKHKNVSKLMIAVEMSRRLTAVNI